MSDHTKHCGACGLVLDRSHFHKRTASVDGLAARCKPCQAVYDADRANKPDRVAARKLYAKSPAGKEKCSVGSKKWAVQNPQKRRAQVAVSNAIRDGLLIKPARCQSCRKYAEITAHHDNYLIPLAVQWLCISCHSSLHKEKRRTSLEKAA